MNFTKALAASTLLASPLSKMPKPQMPPWRTGSPDSVGKAMGKISNSAVRPWVSLWAAPTFQQVAMARVPLQNRLISSPPTMPGSNSMPFTSTRAWRALT